MFWTLGLDRSVLAMVPVVIAICLLLGFLARRLLGFGFRWSFLAALGLSGVVLAMFFSGGRVLEWQGFDVTLLKSCGDSERLGTFDTQAVLNAALYLPVTFAGAMASRRAKLSAACVAALVFLMEALQAATNRGVCETADVVHNLVGVLAGTVAAHLVLRGRDRGSEGSAEVDSTGFRRSR